MNVLEQLNKVKSLVGYHLSQEVATPNIVNTLRLANVYMRQKTGSSLVQLKACRLFYTKPLLETMLTYLPLNLE